MHNLSKISKNRNFRTIVLIALTFCVVSAQILIPIDSRSNEVKQNYLYQVTSSSSSRAFFCTSGQVSCSNMLFPTCADPTFKPTCLPGFVSSIECCKNIGTSLDCNSSIQILCSTTPPATSSSSSSGIVSGVSCTSGKAACTSGLIPACLEDTTFTPTCLPGFPPFIECCKGTGTSFSCRNDLTFSCVTNTTSSGIITNPEPFCSNKQVFCTSSGSPLCTNSAYELTCLLGLPNDFPDCCRKNGFSLDCKPEFLKCSLGELQVDSFTPIDIDVISGPALPDVVEIPLVPDELVSKAGFAYPGSTPSFEIKLPLADDDLEVISLNLKDSEGFVFKNVPFVVTEVPKNPERLILTLEIPESVAEGEINFALKLSNGEDVTFNGRLFTVTPFKTSVLKKKKLETVQVFEPVIKRVKVKKGKKKNKKKVVLKVRGQNFIKDNYFIEKNGVEEFIESKDSSPNTFVTIFPSTLEPKILKKKVSKGRRLLKVKFEVNEPIEEDTKGVLVVSTAAGITSKTFDIKSGKKRKLLLSKDIPVSCFMGKPICENGFKAHCTNSSFSPVCLPGRHTRIPDCCKVAKGIEFSFAEEEDKSLKCDLRLLACPLN